MYRLSLETLTRMEFTGKYHQNDKCSIQQHLFLTIEHFDNPLKNQNTQEIDYENGNELTYLNMLINENVSISRCIAILWNKNAHIKCFYF